jgi:hypothetical protein
MEHSEVIFCVYHCQVYESFVQQQREQTDRTLLRFQLVKNVFSNLPLSTIFLLRFKFSMQTLERCPCVYIECLRRVWDLELTRENRVCVDRSILFSSPADAVCG